MKTQIDHPDRATRMLSRELVRSGYSDTNEPSYEEYRKICARTAARMSAGNSRQRRLSYRKEIMS